tara:strand:- start:923 stop:1468 length:546 start_codon:yes stop_codon:yes gene_type:complete
MVKNTSGGNKHKKKANSALKATHVTEFANDGQYYGVVEKFLGNGRCYLNFIKSFSGKEDDKLIKGIGLFRGKIRKRCKGVSPGDIVLLSCREFESEHKDMAKVDIIIRYKDEDIVALKRANELHPAILKQIESTNQNKSDMSTVEFGDGDDGFDECSKVSYDYSDIYSNMPKFEDDEIDDI